MIGCPIRYPLVTAYLFFILVSFWYGQSRRGSQHSCQKAQKSPGTLRSQGFPHAVSLAFHGGDKRDRTADLLNAIQALSQLSYTPMLPETLDFAGFLSYSIFWLYSPLRGSTPGCLRSQLSYTPMFNFCCFADRTNCILAEYYPFVNYFFVFLPIEREFFVIWELSAIVDYYKQA